MWSSLTKYYELILVLRKTYKNIGLIASDQTVMKFRIVKSPEILCFHRIYPALFSMSSFVCPSVSSCLVSQNGLGDYKRHIIIPSLANSQREDVECLTLSFGA